MFKSITTNKLNTALGLGLMLIVAGFNSSAMAQSKVENDSYQSNEKSGIYGDAPSGLNPIDLMHRAQQLNGRSAAEFDADFQGQLDNSASDFKRLQQQQILQRQQQNAKPVEALEGE